MASAYRTIALKLTNSAAATGDATGSWRRRVAQHALSINGHAVGALGSSGGWGRRLAEGCAQTAGAGSWERRMAGAGGTSGGWPERLSQLPET